MQTIKYWKSGIFDSQQQLSIPNFYLLLGKPDINTHNNMGWIKSV